MDEPHFIAAVRYTERNPVCTGLVERPWDYPWSSARYRVGVVKNDPLVKERQPFGLAIDWGDLLLRDPRETLATSPQLPLPVGPTADSAVGQTPKS